MAPVVETGLVKGLAYIRLTKSGPQPTAGTGVASSQRVLWRRQKSAFDIVAPCHRGSSKVADELTSAEIASTWSESDLEWAQGHADEVVAAARGSL